MQHYGHQSIIRKNISVLVCSVLKSACCLSRMLDTLLEALRAGADTYWNHLNILGRNANSFSLLLATTGSNVALVVS
jgi:hypothetical protein